MIIFVFYVFMYVSLYSNVIFKGKYFVGFFLAIFTIALFGIMIRIFSYIVYKAK